MQRYLLSQFCVLLMSLGFVSCQEKRSVISKLHASEEFVESDPVEETQLEEVLVNNNSLCAEVETLQACEELSESCQPVFLHLEDEESDASFSHCLARTNVEPTSVQVSVELVSSEEKPKPEPEHFPPPAAEKLEASFEPAPVSCKDVDSRYIIGEKKIILCHQTESGKHHTVIVSCRTLWTHSQNHQDYLGPCL